MCNVKSRQLAFQLASAAACTRPPLLLLSEHPDAHQTRAYLYASPQPCAEAAEQHPPLLRIQQAPWGANLIEGRSYLPSRAGLWSSVSIPRGPGARLVLGCFISTWSQVGGAELPSKGRPLLLDEYTQPWGAHGLVSRSGWMRGILAQDASRGVLADSCLRVPMRVPPCGATGLQRAAAFEP